MSSFFISYDRDDAAFVNHLCQLLSSQGIKFWRDLTGLRPGTTDWQLKVEDAIEKSGALLVVLSPRAKASRWVRMEIKYAEARGKQIIPVLVTGDERTSVPIDLVTAQWLDYRGGTPEQVASLTAELQAIVKDLTRKFHLEMIVRGLAHLREHRRSQDIGVTTVSCEYWPRLQVVVGYRVKFQVVWGGFSSMSAAMAPPKPFRPEHDAYLRGKGWEREGFMDLKDSYVYSRTWRLWNYSVETFPRDLTPEMAVVAESLLELHERLGLDVEMALRMTLGFLWPR